MQKQNRYDNWGGFWNTTSLDDDELLREFFEYALRLSYGYRIDIKDNNYLRVTCKSKTLTDMLEMISTSNHNFCIDRTIQAPKDWKIEEIWGFEQGEVGFCTMERDNDIFLYIHMTKENVHKLAEQFNLEKL